MKRKIVIACQGGGSQTAFTAGVLKALFDNKVQDHFNIVSLSGTSGGGICAFFIWYALKKGDNCAWKRLIDFWEDNTAQTYQERLFNILIIDWLELASWGLVPQFNISPSSPLLKMWFSFATLGLRTRLLTLKKYWLLILIFRSWKPGEPNRSPRSCSWAPVMSAPGNCISSAPTTMRSKSNTFLPLLACPIFSRR